MDPVTRAILLSWDWKIEVIVILALAGILYSRGWWRLRQRSRRAGESYGGMRRSPWRLTAVWRLVAYLSGLFFIALALLSPISALSQQLFLMHMVQHLLLVMIAPPLLLIANPMVFMLWGMPDKWRRSTGQAIGKGLHRESRWRHGFRQITNPAAAWFLWVIVLIGWHDPNLYNAALRHEWIHNLEHITFFLAAMLFWWHVTGAGPRIHKQFGLIGRIALVVAAIPPGMLLGVALAFSTGVIYTYYEAVPRLWGIDVLADQQMSGFIMWVPGSMMYIVATLILVFRLLSIEEHKPPLPTSVWASKEAARAPGVKK